MGYFICLRKRRTISFSKHALYEEAILTQREYEEYAEKPEAYQQTWDYEQARPMEDGRMQFDGSAFRPEKALASATK